MRIGFTKAAIILAIFGIAFGMATGAWVWWKDSGYYLEWDKH